MKIFYLDESGEANSGTHKWFVAGGLIVSLEQKHAIEADIEKLLMRTRFNDIADIELHANPIFTGRGKWRFFSREWRNDLLNDALVILRTHNIKEIHGSAIYNANKDQIIKKYLLYIDQFHQILEQNNEYGLVIADKVSFEFELQKACFQKYPRLIEPPFFMDSRASRMLQFADLIAYSYWRRYEKSDYSFFDKINFNSNV